MWSPDSWREKPALQQPEYAEPAELERVLADLHALPPLVTSWEILRLRDQLAEAAEGHQFVLQAGDCAERFVDCTPPRITNTLKVLLQMSLVLVIGARRPVIRIVDLVRPPGRRLRRALRRLHPPSHHQHAQGPPPDVAGAGDRRAPPRNSHWTLRRPVRQTPLRQPGNPRRHQPAFLSRR